MLDHIEEEWKTIIDFEEYQISNLGRVRSLKHNNVYYLNPMLRGYKNNQYKCVKLFGKKYQKVFAVHRLVAMYFIPNPNNYPIINHIDENTLNNIYTNLEWCSYSYNIKYGNCPNKRKTKLLNRKDCSKPVEMYSLNGKFLKEFPSLREAGRFIGKENNITDITNCCNGYKINGTPVHKAYGFIWKWKKDI